MPRLSIWMIRAALTWLAVGALVGAVLLGAPKLSGGGFQWRALHAEMLLVGWTVQLALGVAHWILPRFRAGAERGREGPGWVAFVLVNLGVLLAGAGGALASGWSTVAGRSAEPMAAVAFAVQACPRVKPFRS